MRTTMFLDDDIMAQAQALTGIKVKSRLLLEALNALIAWESARRLARSGGSARDIGSPPRRRRTGN
jgi:Arc/MetJ family transcription regulator